MYYTPFTTYLNLLIIPLKLPLTSNSVSHFPDNPLQQSFLYFRLIPMLNVISLSP